MFFFKPLFLKTSPNAASAFSPSAPACIAFSRGARASFRAAQNWDPSTSLAKTITNVFSTGAARRVKEMGDTHVSNKFKTSRITTTLVYVRVITSLYKFSLEQSLLTWHTCHWQSKSIFFQMNAKCTLQGNFRECLGLSGSLYTYSGTHSIWLLHSLWLRLKRWNQ